MKNLIMILGLSLSVYLYAQDGESYTFTLEEAKIYALENNLRLKNSQLDIEAARKKVLETTAIGLPHADASLAFSYTPVLSDIIEQFSLFGNLGSWMYSADQYLNQNDPDNPAFGHVPPPAPPMDLDAMKWSLPGTITVSQLIFNGSYIVGLQSAKVYKSLSEINHLKSEQEVIELVTNSYFNVLIAHENKIILDSIYHNLQKTFSDIQAMGKQGFIEDTDIDQMQITVLNVKSSLDMITRMEGVAEKLLKWQLGIDLEKSVKLEDNLNSLIEGLSYDQLLLADLIMENNADYQMLDASVKASHLLLKLNKSAYLPSVAAFYQYQKEFNENAFNFNPPHLIGAQLNVPIFASGEKSAKVSQAKINLMKAQNDFDQYSDGIKLDYFNTHSALMTSIDQFKTESVNLQLSKRIYDKSLIKYSNGMISGTDLNQIQTQFLQSQSNYYIALQKLIESKSKLEKLLAKTN